MAEDILKHDWYKLLGCSVDFTKEQISKASRKLSLKYHPDKNPSKSAENMFLLIQKAKEVLLDDDARLAYDTALKKVVKRKEYDEQRRGKMDSSKKRMRDELEQRMRHATEKPRGGESKELKRAREQDIHNIRRENMARMESHNEESVRRDAELKQFVADVAARRNEKNAAAAGAEELSVCLKVKWRKSDTSQSEETLVNVFKTYGHIEFVQLGGSKGSSAVLVFSDANSVQKAIEGMDDSVVYKVSRIDDPKQPAIFSHRYATKVPTADGYSNNSDPTGLMSHVRRAVEREELLRSMSKEHLSKQFESIESNKQTKPAEPSVFKAPAASVFASAFSTSAPSASQLKSKENDVLQKMLEAAALKKKNTQTTE